MFESHYLILKLNQNELDSVQLELASRRMLKYWNLESELEDKVIKNVDDITLSQKITYNLIQARK